MVGRTPLKPAAAAGSCLLQRRSARKYNSLDRPLPETSGTRFIHQIEAEILLYSNLESNLRQSQAVGTILTKCDKISAKEIEKSRFTSFSRFLRGPISKQTPEIDFLEDFAIVNCFLDKY